MRNAAEDDNSDLVAEESTEIVEVEKVLSDRHELFCQNYVTNGFNATQAYIAVGYESKNANVQASQLLAKRNVVLRIEELKVARLAFPELSLEKTLQQLAAITQFDQRKLFNADGTPIPMHLLDAATSAAISHIGKHGPVPFNKMSGLDMAMKYLGAFEKDNSQRAPNLALQIVYE